MRRLEFDQFEFPNPTTEEHLILTLEGKESAGDIKSFLSRCENGVKLVSVLEELELEPFQGSHGYINITDYIHIFSEISKEDMQQARYAKLAVSDDEEILIFETPKWYLLYQWETSA